MTKPTRFNQEMIDDYVAKGFWDRVCIADILEQNARNWPDKGAIVDSELHHCCDPPSRLPKSRNPLLFLSNDLST